MRFLIVLVLSLLLGWSVLAELGIGHQNMKDCSARSSDSLLSERDREEYAKRILAQEKKATVQPASSGDKAVQ